MSERGSEEYLGDVMAAGALFGMLHRNADITEDLRIQSVIDERGQVTPAFTMRIPYLLNSEYRISIEIVPGSREWGDRT